ncbi:very short patch repair endonuclease, partial [Chloroflexota bacterium]
AVADKFSKEKRSIIMSHISGKETKPEVLIRKLLFAKGLRYRKNVKSLRGKPDIVLPKYRTVVFIHGCFWHGHEDCPKAKLPDTRREFWEKKISGNMDRDMRLGFRPEKGGAEFTELFSVLFNTAPPNNNKSTSDISRYSSFLGNPPGKRR